MLLPDFPQEIIEKITDFLPVKDKASCSLVCKAWRRLFRDSLYSDLLLNHQLLDALVNTPENNQDPYIQHRHLVQYLHTHETTQVTDKEFYALQKTFPNIKYIHLELNGINSDNFGTIADWNIWKSAREFHILFNYSHLPDLKDQLVKVIMCLPLLRRLEIIKENFRLHYQIMFSLNTIETIHSHLKHLGHLRINLNLLTLSETDLENISRVSPATNMGSLSMTSTNTDYRWLCYFARKYPNLHTLDFSAKDIPPSTKEQMDNIMTLFQQVPQPFQRLTRLTISYVNCFEKDCLLFFEMLRYHNVPLKHIRMVIRLPYGTIYPSSISDTPKNIIEFCLTQFAETINSFCLPCLIMGKTPTDLMRIKDSLYNLVELNINIQSKTIELDSLLSAAPRLKSLELNFTDIKVKDELYSSKRFVLQSFKISYSEITSDVLRFLSFHCRDLNVLYFRLITVYGNFTTPGCQFIDLTYSHLQTLTVDNMEFIINDNKESPDNLNIALITRPVDDIPPKREYSPKLSPVVPGKAIKAHYYWFYRKDQYKMKNISKSQGSRITKFVSNYEENKRITMERALQIKRRTPSDRWKDICIFGYTRIKLGYVADCNICSKD